MERLQVLVALKRRNRAIRLSVPVPVLYLAAVLLLVSLFLTGFLAQVLLNRHTDYGRLKRLVAENYRLKARLAAYAVAVDSFRGFLARTEEMDNRLRCASGLQLIPDEVRMLGVGGSPLPVSEPEIDVLLRRMEFEERSLTEIGHTLKEQEQRLGRLPSIWPVQGWVTSGFGMRRDPFTRSLTMHEGIDIVAPAGTPVVATADGVVTFSGWKSGWGRCLEIDHGDGLRTFYAHCRSLAVSVGDRVVRGRKVGTVGSSGRSTGTHLHYGVKRNGIWVNPRDFIIS